MIKERVVYKYEGALSDHVSLILPEGSEIIHVDKQSGLDEETIQIWALVPKEYSSERLKTVRIAGTSHPIFEENLRFIKPSFQKGRTTMLCGEKINVNYIEVEGQKGTLLSSCLEDAIVLAMTQKVQVRLKFNDKIYLIEPRSLVESIHTLL